MRIGPIIIALVVSCELLTSQAQEKPRTTKSTGPVKSDDFAGLWSGAWDRKYSVRFTIYPLSPKGAYVRYEWQEKVDEDLTRRGGVGSIEGSTITFSNMQMTLADHNRQRADAVGDFTQRRTAKLVRSDPPDEFLNSKLSLAKEITIEKPLELAWDPAIIYFATEHNLLLRADTTMTREDGQKLRDIKVTLPAQKDVVLEKLIRQMLIQSGMNYRFDGKEVRYSFKKK